MIIESTAPPRVDLAGGTIDIWPLYLFHPGATTVNFALSLYARVRIETNDDGRIVLESRNRRPLAGRTARTDLEARPLLQTNDRVSSGGGEYGSRGCGTRRIFSAGDRLHRRVESLGGQSLRGAQVCHACGERRIDGDQSPRGFSGLLSTALRFSFVRSLSH